MGASPSVPVNVLKDVTHNLDRPDVDRPDVDRPEGESSMGVTVVFTGSHPLTGRSKSNLRSVTSPPLRQDDYVVWGGVHGKVSDVIMYDKEMGRFHLPAMNVKKIGKDTREVFLTTIDLEAINDSPMYKIEKTEYDTLVRNLKYTRRQKKR